MKLMRSATLAMLLLGSWLGTSFQAYAKPIHHTSAETCSLCHKQIFKQWKGSMHANSTAFKDPIHATFYKKVMGDPGKEGLKSKKGKYPVCLNCHAPNAARDKKTKLDSKVAYNEGVNCVACHTLTKFKGVKGKDGKLKLGIKAYTLSDSIQAPGKSSVNGLKQLTASNDMFGDGGDNSKPNPHLGKDVELDGKTIAAIPMETNAKQVRTSKNCMGCHDQRNNGHDVPLCATGDEYAKSQSNVDCLACHMPDNDGLADHSMGGGHSQAMLERSVILGLNSKKSGKNLAVKVDIENLQPHSLPTGAPFRNIYLTVKAYNSAGEVVWSSSKKHPAKDDKKAYFSYALIDAKGKPTSPPKAKGVGVDTRLKPFEKRNLSYKVPAKGVVLVRAELHYNLLWKGLVKKFKHLDKDLTAPVLMAAAEVKIK